MQTYYLVNNATGSLRIKRVPTGSPRPKVTGHTTYTNQAQAYAAAQRIAGSAA